MTFFNLSLKSYIFVSLQNHLENCRKIPLPCPNSCGDVIPREMVSAFHCSLSDVIKDQSIVSVAGRRVSILRVRLLAVFLGSCLL